MVDGLGVGDVGTIVLRDRQQLSQDGVLVISLAFKSRVGVMPVEPEIVSRGFVYVRESELLLEEAKEKVKDVLASAERLYSISDIKNLVRETLSGFLWERTRRRPMIIPVVLEI